MNYSKYSKEAFEKRGINSDRARELADVLQEDVLKELHQELQNSFNQIITKLNNQGHDLTPYVELVPGEYCYRGKEENGNCGLRLACDVVISSGYSDIITIET